MERIIALIAAASVIKESQGFKYDGLRVKYGWSDLDADRDYFYHIPRTLKQAEAEGWTRLTSQSPRFQTTPLHVYCMQQSKTVCGLYGLAGYIAGLQINLPEDEFVPAPDVNPEKLFKKITVTAKENNGTKPRTYWTIFQYFESKGKKGVASQGGAVYVRGPDDKMMLIPYTQRALFDLTLFKRQNCVPNMGIHYYYNMTPALKCEKLFPWSALVTEGHMFGTGLLIFGRLRKQPFRRWFDDIIDIRRSIEIAIPDAPPCLADWAEKYGLLSLHIYYVNNPWDIRCNDGDSIRPVSGLNGLLVNGYRWAVKFQDEIKKRYG